MAKTVVILGASFAGIPIAHHLLTHTAPLIPDLKVILVYVLGIIQYYSSLVTSTPMG